MNRAEALNGPASAIRTEYGLSKAGSRTNALIICPRAKQSHLVTILVRPRC